MNQVKCCLCSNDVLIFGSLSNYGKEVQQFYEKAYNIQPNDTLCLDCLKPSEEYLKHYIKSKWALKLHSMTTICNFCSGDTNDPLVVCTDLANMCRSDLGLMNFIQDLYIRSARMESSPEEGVVQEKGDKCGTIVCNECCNTMKRFYIHWLKYSKSPEALAQRNETAGPSNATASTNKSSSSGQSLEFWGDTNKFPSASSSVYTPQNEPSNRGESSSPDSASNIEVIAVGSSPESQSDTALNTEVIAVGSSPESQSDTALNTEVIAVGSSPESQSDTALNTEVIAVGSSPESQSDTALNTEVIAVGSSPESQSDTALNIEVIAVGSSPESQSDTALNIEVIAVGSSPESQSDTALNTEVIDITSSSPDNKSDSASNSSVGVEEQCSLERSSYSTSTSEAE